MFHRGLTFLSFGRMIRGVGSPRTFPSTPGFRGPGARGQAKEFVLQDPNLGRFSVGLRRVEEARTTALACHDACSHILTSSDLRSPAGLGFHSSLLPLVSRSYNGRVAVFHCIRGYGRRRAWCTIVSPTRRTRFRFRPLHARLVWCWSVCLWCVFDRVLAPAVVWLVHGCLSRLTIGFFDVGSIALQPEQRQPDIVVVVVSVVSGVCCS